jgi:hypothetical protein
VPDEVSFSGVEALPVVLVPVALVSQYQVSVPEAEPLSVIVTGEELAQLADGLAVGAPGAVGRGPTIILLPV